jgi:hypothetical protein
MKEELKVIQDLMADLMEKMEYGEDDFSERLGREKPKVEVMKMEMGEPEEMESEEDCMPEMEEELGPEEKLKQRLMKLRA